MKLIQKSLKLNDINNTSKNSGIIIILIGIWGIIVLITRNWLLASFYPAHIQMALDTSIFMILLGSVIHFNFAKLKIFKFSGISQFICLIIGLYGLLKFGELIIGIDFMFDINQLTENKAIGVMSPITGLLFFVSCTGILFYIKSKKNNSIKLYIEFCGIFVLLISFIVLTGYLFGTPFFYGGRFIPIAASTSIGFFFIGLSLSACFGSSSVLLSYIIGQTVRARLLRYFLPLVLSVILIQGLAYQSLRQLFDLNLAMLTTILNLFFALITGILIIRVSQIISNIIEKETFERRKVEAELYSEKERLLVTLQSIGDAVIATDVNGDIIFMNSVAEYLTGWNLSEAVNKNSHLVFKIIDGYTREQIPNPVDRVLKTEKIVNLANNTILISKNGIERIIADSGSPIRDFDKKIFGVILVFRDETEKHNSLVKLKESESRFRSLFENASDPMLLLDDSNHFFDCNNAAYKILGGESKDSVIGKTPEDISPEFQPDGIKSFDKARTVINEAFKNQNTQFEWAHKTFDGKLLTFDISLSVISFGFKNVLLTNWRDITERKKIEMALQESNELFDQFMTYSPIYVFFKDENIRSLKLSKNYEQMINRPISDLIGKNMFELFPSELASKMVEDDKNILKNGEPIYVDEELNGRFYTTIKFPVFQNGKPKLLAGFTMDITENKLANAALEQRLIALTSPLDNISDIKFEDLFNIEEIQKVQDAFAKATGVASMITDTEGKPITNPSNFCVLCSDIIRKTEKGLANCYRSDSLIGGSNNDKPIIQRCFSGGLFDTGTSINIGGKKIAHWLIGQVVDENFDINELQAYAKEIGADEIEFNKALNSVTRMTKEKFEQICNALFLIAAQLSKLALQNVQQARFISERKIAEEELINAKNKAEESDWLKSAFLANMSHEIRTPMNAILGFSQLLDSADLSDNEKHEYVHFINKRGNDLLNLINDILDISKIEANQLTLNYSTDDVNKLLFEVHSQFSSMSEFDEQKPIVLKISKILISNSIINTDFSRLKQILNNLISNALKFTKKGSIEFGCSLESKDTLKFFVKDSGIGIPINKQLIIFERFRQVEESLSRKHQGTGLGLSISKGLVELLKGKIWVESVENGGATFYFTIPYLPVNSIKKEIIVSNKKTYNWENKLILVVEDDIYNAKFLIKILSQSKVKYHLEKDGNSAIGYVKSNPNIDLILMDIQLPDINGYDVTKIIKSIKPDLNVIAQTAYAFPEDRKKSSDAGCCDLITKPIDKNLLLAKIDKYIK